MTSPEITVCPPGRARGYIPQDEQWGILNLHWRIAPQGTDHNYTPHHRNYAPRTSHQRGKKTLK